jgi:hypothetical protein
MIVDAFDDVLAVVEHAVYRDVVDVVVLEAEHLSLLKRAHPPAGEHEDPYPFFAAQRILPHSRYRRRSRQDCSTPHAGAPVRTPADCRATAWPCL